MKRALRNRLVCLLLLTAGSAVAQAPPSAPASDAVKSDARAQFDRGVVLFEQGAFEQALTLFRRSLELYPTRAAGTNVVLCLKRLGRFDEALDAVEALRDRFGVESAADRAEFEAEIAELSKQVGSLDLRGVAQGSQIEIDGVVRATAPIASPIRVSRGEHRVRVTHAERAPIETRAYVVGGKIVALDVRQDPLLVPSTSAEPESGAAPRRPESADVFSPRRVGIACRICAGVEVGWAAVPKWGGDVAGSSAGFGVLAMAHGAYGIAPAWSLSVDGGYLMVSTSVSGRPTQVNPVGDANGGTASDDLALRGALLGASLAFRSGDAPAIKLRLGAGALVAALEDRRSGLFEGRLGDGMARPPKYSVVQTERRPAEYAYVSLSGEIDFPLAPKLRAGVGVNVMALVAMRQPAWDDGQNFLGPDGDSRFSSETLAGTWLVMPTPFAGLEYAF